MHLFQSRASICSGPAAAGLDVTATYASSLESQNQADPNILWLKRMIPHDLQEMNDIFCPQVFCTQMQAMTAVDTSWQLRLPIL